MGNCRDRRRCPRRSTVRRLPRQKTAVEEATQGQGPQEGHEGSDGCQGRSDVGGVDNEGTTDSRTYCTHHDIEG